MAFKAPRSIAPFMPDKNDVRIKLVSRGDGVDRYHWCPAETPRRGGLIRRLCLFFLRCLSFGRR
jgi:hypothetical protein